MLYRVVAGRSIWAKVKNSNGKQLLAKSRIDFSEESDLEYNDYCKEIKRQLNGWIFSISILKETQNGY